MSKPTITLGLSDRTKRRLRRGTRAASGAKPTPEECDELAEFFRLPKQAVRMQVGHEPMRGTVAMSSQFQIMGIPKVETLRAMKADIEREIGPQIEKQRLQQNTWTVKHQSAKSLVAWLHGELQPGSSDHIVQAINNAKGDVHLAICSEGGNADEMNNIIGAIERLQRRGGSAHAHAAGHCCSAALNIMLACDVRSALPDTRFLLHNCQLSKPAANADQLADCDDESTHAAMRIAKTTGVDELQVRAWMDTETTFVAGSGIARSLGITTRDPYAELQQRKDEMEAMRIQSIHREEQRQEAERRRRKAEAAELNRQRFSMRHVQQADGRWVHDLPPKGGWPDVVQG